MKRKCKIYLLLCFAAIGLCGCMKRPRQLCRYVTRVEIFCDHDGLPIRRSYTDTEKMESVLLYLRLLKPGTPPVTDPDTVEADIFEITVSLSDGQQHVYSQKDHRYFRQADNGWQSILPERAAQLYTLLRHYQSDL